MKKLITFIFTLCMAISAFGQNWVSKEYEADIVKGTQSSKWMTYEASDFTLAFQTDAEKPFKTFSIMLDNNKMFSDGAPDVPRYTRVDLKVGILDENGNILDHFTLYLRSQGEERWHIARYNSDIIGCKKGCSKIIDHLSNGKGSVRIIIPIYQEDDIDTNIPCIAH